MGGTEKITIPEGTQPGATFRLRGKGLPDVNSRNGERGEQVVAIKVKVPTRLSDDQRRLIKELATASGETLHTEDRGFFGKLKGTISHK